MSRATSNGSGSRCGRPPRKGPASSCCRNWPQAVMCSPTTVAGDLVPENVALINPMQQRYIDALTDYSVEQLRERVIQPGDRVYSSNALLCACLPGGAADI